MKTNIARSHLLRNTLLSLAIALVSVPAEAANNQKISLKIAGVMRCLALGSSKFCYVRLMFQNQGKSDVIIPFEFASARLPKNGQPFVSLDVEHGEGGNALNLTTCATAVCEWRSARSKKTFRAVARILDSNPQVRPNDVAYCTIEIPRPPKDFYKLRVHFDNKKIAEVTKMLADFNGSNPQFFEADDEVAVEIR